MRSLLRNCGAPAIVSIVLGLFVFLGSYLASPGAPMGQQLIDLRLFFTVWILSSLCLLGASILMRK